MLQVQSGSHAYPIDIRPGAIADLAAIAAPVLDRSGRATLIVDELVAQSHGAAAVASLSAAGVETTTLDVRAHESLKTLATVERLYRQLVRIGHERSMPIIAVGGGITGDIAGFVAATWLRGIPVVQVPTTLLSMVDASVGGKTGVNFAVAGSARRHETLAKNIIGAFWPPQSVVIDPEVLGTLERRHRVCGWAEVIKHAVLADPTLLDDAAACEADFEPSAPALASVIRKAVEIKAAVVTEDEREAGKRMLLNLGHTFAHAIESHAHDAILHGEAVAIGMMAAFHLAAEREMVSSAWGQRVQETILACGLPTTLPADWTVTASDMRATMHHDKKKERGTIRFVLPSGECGADLIDDVSDESIDAAWSAVGAQATV